MDDETWFEELRGLGSVADSDVARWQGLARLLALFEALGRQGAVAVLKVDGERREASYTVVISGGPLGNTSFRKDGDDPHALLREAIEFCRDHVWRAGK